MHWASSSENIRSLGTWQETSSSKPRRGCPGTRTRVHLMAPQTPFFTNLDPDSIVEIHPDDDRYNCIAWAADDNTKVWWPIDSETSPTYWPESVPRELTVGAFITV